MVLPLDGVRVVEVAQNLAGPYAAEILALLGAEVVKVERPGGGDDARGWGPPFVEGTATSFHSVNRNKRSVAVDLRDPRGVAWLKAFVRERDILVPVEWARQLTDALSDGQLREVAEFGHETMIRNAGPTATLIRAFLEGR